MSNAIAERLRSLGIVLPPAPAALGSYVPAVLAGNVLYISGQVSKAADGTIVAGQLGAGQPGAGLTVEQGQAAARLSALNILAAAEAALGSLDRIVRVLRLNGFVNAAPGFTDHPKVVNGASDLLVEVLGEKGRHTRAALGCSSLPAGAATEIDAVLLVDP